MLNTFEEKLEEMDIENKSLEQIVQELEDMLSELGEDIFDEDIDFLLTNKDLVEEEDYINVEVILEDDELELSERESQWFA